MPANNLTQGVVAITGGARGIGRATAQRFARAGARVAIGDLDGELAAQAAGEIGAGALGLELDVTDPGSVEAFVDRVERELGPIDVFVNNAGIMPVGPLLEESHAIAQRQLAVNVAGPLHGMKAVLPRMLGRGRGHIVNVASGAGKVGYPGGVTYCASKHAVVGLSEAARRELRGTPVGLTMVLPAAVNTELTSGFTGKGASKCEPEHVAAAIVDAVANGRFEVWVPRAFGRFNRIVAALPLRARDRAITAIGGDTTLLQTDQRAREAYERRVRAGVEGPSRTPA